jgi:hypothetical protein
VSFSYKGAFSNLQLLNYKGKSGLTHALTNWKGHDRIL